MVAAGVDAWRRALRADDPVQALRAVADERLTAGGSREQLVEQLTVVLLEIRRDERSDEAEAPILDVLDMLTGWCAPGCAI